MDFDFYLNSNVISDITRLITSNTVHIDILEVATGDQYQTGYISLSFCQIAD